MPKFQAKAEAAEHDPVDWKVGARKVKNDGRDACYFSPGGRLYATIPAALTRMDEGPRLPTRAEQIKAAGGIKARLALCLSRATLLRPALCANVLGEFVRALLPRSTSRRAGRPVGSTPLRVRTAFFQAVMFLLHCYPHIVPLTTPRVVSSFPQRS